MKMKNNLEIETTAVLDNMKKLINQIYKLLPVREEQLDWNAPLNTIIEEFFGMDRLFVSYHSIFFSLLCKLEGLKKYTEEEDFYEYRRTVFECLSLANSLKQSIEEEELCLD